MRVNKDCDVYSPAERDGSVIQIEKPVRILETVLSQHEMPDFFAEHADVNSPAFNWNIDYAAVVACLPR